MLTASSGPATFTLIIPRNRLEYMQPSVRVVLSSECIHSKVSHLKIMKDLFGDQLTEKMCSPQKKKEKSYLTATAFEEGKLKQLKFTLPFAPFSNLETRFLKATGHTYTPKEKIKFMKMIAEYMEPYENFFNETDYCLKIKIVLYCDRPKKAPAHVPEGLWRKDIYFYKPTRPDGDNYLKPLQDAMSHHVIETIILRWGKQVSRGAGIIPDDSFLVDTRIIKLYRKLSEEARMRIIITKLPIKYDPAI